MYDLFLMLKNSPLSIVVLLAISAVVCFLIWAGVFQPPYVVVGHAAFLFLALLLFAFALLLYSARHKGNSDLSEAGSYSDMPFRLSAQAGSDDIEVFELTDAISFYTKVSKVYEARLTRDYYDTIRAIEEEILSRATNGLKIIDIGGGTGMLLRKFELFKRISWTYIDPSEGMHRRFSEIYSGTPNLVTMLGSLKGCMPNLAANSYDIAIASFVVSSLPSTFFWSDTKLLLKSGGILLLADGHPRYGVKEPYFGIEIDAWTKLRLKISHIDPAEMKRQAANAGFIFVSEKTIFLRCESDQPYSFLHVYQRA